MFTALIAMLVISPADSLASMSRRAALAAAAATTGMASMGVILDQSAFEAVAAGEAPTPPTIAAPQPAKPKFQRYPQIRFIAALGDPQASAGTGADAWGLWRDDPGPRGVYLRNYVSVIQGHNNVAPAGWKFDKNDWWLEEHGLLMSNPEPLLRKKWDPASQQILPYKRYVVTGDRTVTTILTVFDNGRWELQKGSLYDVTHLPCRSARYTPPSSAPGGTTCRPTSARANDFPVQPGAAMPGVPGCAKQDYAVLFVLGEEV